MTKRKQMNGKEQYRCPTCARFAIKPIIRGAEKLNNGELTNLLELVMKEKMQMYYGLTSDTDWCYSFDVWDDIEDKLRTMILNNEGVGND
jgi:hypothetical protein